MHKVLVALLCPILYDPMNCSPQAPLSMDFSRQEHWSGWPFPSPGDLPCPGIKPRSPALQADSFMSEPPGKPEHKRMQKYTLDLDEGDSAHGLSVQPSQQYWFLP